MSNPASNGSPVPTSGQEMFSSILVSDENDRTEHAANLRGRTVQLQGFTNQSTVLHENTRFVNNAYTHPENLRQNIDERNQPTVTTLFRQNIGGTQPQPKPTNIQKQPASNYRQLVGDRDKKIGPCGIFSFIGVIITTICILAFCILLGPK